jgi:hypothetical protein
MGEKIVPGRQGGLLPAARVAAGEQPVPVSFPSHQAEQIQDIMTAEATRVLANTWTITYNQFRTTE